MSVLSTHNTGAVARAGALVLCVGGLVGCGTPGELGEATFSYDCDAEADAACSLSQEFPELLAVGGRFDVTADRKGSSQPLAVDTAGSERIAGSGSGLQFASPGTGSLLALDGATVVDVLNLHADEVDALDFSTFMEPLEISVGDFEPLDVEPSNASGQRLGGALSYDWEVTPTGVVAIDPPTGARSVTLDAVGAGQATVQVTESHSGVAASFEVIVEDGP